MILTIDAPDESEAISKLTQIVITPSDWQAAECAPGEGVGGTDRYLFRSNS